MLVSVCMATYNGEEFISEQLQSILNQDFRGELEIIISDDGSTDKTLEIIESLNSLNISVIAGPKQGLIKNFEHALNHANGDVFFLCDQDDIWLPGKINTTLKYLPDYSLVVSDAVVVDENLETLSSSFYALRNSGQGVLKNLFRNSFLGCCMAFNREVLDASLPFPSNTPMHDWWIGLVANSIGKVYFIDKPLILYRRHGSNASDTAEKSSHSLLTQLKWRTQITTSLILRKLIRN